MNENMIEYAYYLCRSDHHVCAEEHLILLVHVLGHVGCEENLCDVAFLLAGGKVPVGGTHAEYKEHKFDHDIFKLREAVHDPCQVEAEEGELLVDPPVELARHLAHFEGALHGIGHSMFEIVLVFLCAFARGALVEAEPRPVFSDNVAPIMFDRTEGGALSFDVHQVEPVGGLFATAGEAGLACVPASTELLLVRQNLAHLLMIVDPMLSLAILRSRGVKRQRW